MSAANSPTCAWPGCGKSGAAKKCGRCRRVQYCNREHQKAHWGLHKVLCTDAPHHSVPSTDASIDTIQSVIDQANPGDVVQIPEGTYKPGSSGTVEVRKPLRLRGAGMNKTRIEGDLMILVPPTNHSDSELAVCDLGIDGIVEILETEYKQITFLSVEVFCPAPRATKDAFTVECKGKILLNCCEICGGSDGLALINDDTEATIRETDVQLARNRGIFANPYFTIGPGAAVYNCGGYGIKGRSGWDEKGKNQIQPGPWSPFGGAAY